jgi:hypothetical protein
MSTTIEEVIAREILDSRFGLARGSGSSVLFAKLQSLVTVTFGTKEVGR